MSMRRSLSFVLALALMVSLAGIASAAQTKLRIVGFSEPGIEQSLEYFRKQNPDIELEVLNTDFEAVTVMILGGDPPDVFRIEQGTYGDWAERGWLYDITEYIERDPVLSSPGYLMPQEIERIYRNGRAYGFGSSWSSAILYYNKDMFDEAGLDYPPARAEEAWTWDQFTEAGLKLTQDRSGLTAMEAGFNPERVKQYGIAGGVPQWWLTDMAIIMSNGGKFFNDTYDGFALDHPRTLEALQMIADWRHKYKIYAGWMPWKNAAMQIWGSWDIGTFNQTEGLNLGLGVLPKAADIPYPVTWLQGHMYAMPYNVKDPDAAWRFLRFVATPEFQGPVVAQGIWLPTLLPMYTPEGLGEWYSERIHGLEYFDAVLAFSLEHGVAFHHPRYLDDALALYGPAAAAVIVEGTKTPKQAIDEVLDAMNQVLRTGPKE